MKILFRQENARDTLAKGIVIRNKEEKKMMIPINVVAEILRSALDFTNGVVSKFDDEKYAKAVSEIYGHAPDYSELNTLEELIKNASDISTMEKKDLLFALTDKRTAIREREIENKRECAKIVSKGFEKKCKAVRKLALAFATGGLSLLPDLYHAIEGGMKDKLEIEPNPK